MLADEDYSKLKPQQLRAIALIVAGKTNTEVAEILGIRLATVSRWRNHDPDFRRVLGSWLKQRIVDYSANFSSKSRQKRNRA